ncbi:MAG: LytTR family DNA-binding domain-containing protein [Candidatus Fournierella pullistercoris]|uniref:Stage 0 sporulation protein A homolog n=1 Tax=Candidatus Allofournierella pullistercoris TaxID=2838597 RepID=A0A948T0S8_9FIRM|nr:LytTR family DNA-binding domain-containing protein [Candidatus Fournierella pullistercoris]
MRFAVCDDQPAYLRQVAQLIQTFLAQKDLRFPVDCFGSAPEFSDALACNHYDAVFLDVEMPKVSGLALAEQLKQQHPTTRIIFVSNHLDYAPQGYQVSAFRYLLKEQLSQTFAPCMQALWEQLHPKNQTILLRSGGQDVEVALPSVAYFEASGHHVIAHFINPTQEKLVCNTSLGQLANELSDSDFHLVQRSFLVNFWVVKRFLNYTVILSTGQTIPVSKPLFRDLQREFLLWKAREESC